MSKRYQVFISSTFEDLKEERQQVMQALLQLDCIPSGMELFPAANENQLSLIKKVIDDCDYFIVILAGRYGSLGPDGLSYTEIEYRYALEKGKPVLGFLYIDPDKLPVEKSERSDRGRERLAKFREFVKKRLCRYWDSPAKLGLEISTSLNRLIVSEPAVGWIRGEAVKTLAKRSVATNDSDNRTTSSELDIVSILSTNNPHEIAKALAVTSQALSDPKMQKADGTSEAQRISICEMLINQLRRLQRGDAVHPPMVTPTFTKRSGTLHVESVPLTEISSKYGTPCYVYSRSAIEAAYRSYSTESLGAHIMSYSVTANSNLAVLAVLNGLGSMFQITSGGELARVRAAGISANRVIFVGVGKLEWEIKSALNDSIYCFNVESEEELDRLSLIATSCGQRARVAFRINPNLDATAHPYIAIGLRENKFGIPIEDAHRILQKAATLPAIETIGLSFHIGSQITNLSPFIEAVDKTVQLVGELASSGIRLQHIDVGGGVGIRYDDPLSFEIKDYVEAMSSRIQNTGLKLMLAPGRSIVGDAGLLLTKVEYLRSKNGRNYAIVDASMNDLFRPALYDAYHEVISVIDRPGKTLPYDIVGPIPESGDFLARERYMSLEQGDLLAVMSAGAYGMSMSSNYTSRPRAAEVLVDDKSSLLIRSRETLQSLYYFEQRP